MEIDDELFEDLRIQALKNKSQKEDLIIEYIKNALNNKTEEDNMQSVSIPDDIMDRMNKRCKEIHCNPEKLIHAILFDYLRSVERIPATIDREKLWAMLEHDKPEGDDTLKKLRQLGDVGWE